MVITIRGEYTTPEKAPHLPPTTRTRTTAAPGGGLLAAEAFSHIIYQLLVRYLPKYHTSNAPEKAPTSRPSVNDTSFKWCSFYAYQLVLCLSVSWMLRFMQRSDQDAPINAYRVWGKLKIKFTRNAFFFRDGLSGWSFRSRQNSHSR